jgi:hypothetical protein
MKIEKLDLTLIIGLFKEHNTEPFRKIEYVFAPGVVPLIPAIGTYIGVPDGDTRLVGNYLIEGVQHSLKEYEVGVLSQCVIISAYLNLTSHVPP